MTEHSANRPYYPALDGLRGVAILLVVLHHNFGFIQQSYFGWLGVDLFFVLSGFLITDILLTAVGKPNALINFYMRRILRIFPLYYLTLILFLFILPAFTQKINWNYYIENQFFLWTYLQNWLYIFKDPDHAQILNHYWSLAVEEQFYIFWPVAIILIKKPKYLLWFISILLLLVVVFRCGLWIYKIEKLPYYNLYTFSRIDGICIGCIMALLKYIKTDFIERNMAFIVSAFALLNFLFYYLNSRSSFSFPYLAFIGYTTFAMMFGILVYEAAGNRSKIINAIFDIGVLKFFGRISYSFYIFHWPVYLIFSTYLAGTIKDKFPGIPGQFAIAVIATLLAAVISWLSRQYFESYFLKLKTRYN
jgi:peptidoglycan/LPS O-acetylase OafA/YrhL